MLKKTIFVIANKNTLAFALHKSLQKLINFLYNIKITFLILNKLILKKPYILFTIYLKFQWYFLVVCVQYKEC